MWFHIPRSPISTHLLTQEPINKGSDPLGPATSLVSTISPLKALSQWKQWQNRAADLTNTWVGNATRPYRITSTTVVSQLQYVNYHSVHLPMLLSINTPLQFNHAETHGVHCAITSSILGHAWVVLTRSIYLCISCRNIINVSLRCKR